MLKKGGTHSFISKCITICSTFLVVGIVLFNTTISVFAVQNYSHINDTDYKAADCWGLEELPFGEDTGVIQIWYGDDRYLTFFFDKLSIYDRYDPYFLKGDTDINGVYQGSYLKDYYWDIKWTRTNGKLDYILNIVSDSSIYWTTSYDSDIYSFSAAGYYRSRTDVSLIPPVGTPDDETGDNSKSYGTYELKDVLLSNFVDWDVPTSYSNRSVISNKFQVRVSSLRYYPMPATGNNSSTTGDTNVGYSIMYYPTIEYLNNAELRQDLIFQWNELIDINANINQGFSDVLTELYNVNFYLNEIYNYTQYIYNDLTFWLPLIESDLVSIHDILEEMKSGPEYDSSQGIGSNTEFGDSFGNLTEDTVVPGIGTDSIVHSLGNSFLFIRNMFDKITVDFNLVYIITFLLGLSFIAYVLGRVIKNKMNG